MLCFLVMEGALKPKKHLRLVAKSRAACLSAIETYNRASAMYREETFAILMINAWELLLKARIMCENDGKASALFELMKRKNKNGGASKVKEFKRTKCGAPMTIGIEKAYNIVSGYSKDRIDEACIANIEALTEIRDTATHFVASDTMLRKKLTELSLAAVKNYVTAAQGWFKLSFSDLNIASIPISFDLDQKGVDAVAKKPSSEVAKFLAHMQKVEVGLKSVPSDYTFSIRIDFDLIKSKDDSAVKAAVVKSDADLTVMIEGDKVPTAFPWTYNELVGRLKDRYADYKQNSKFNDLMKPVKMDDKLHYVRYLDPTKKTASKKSYFSSNVLKALDSHYALKDATLFEPKGDKTIPV